MWSDLRRLFGQAGVILLVLVAGAAAGTALTALVAPLAPIPIIGIIADPFIPFPTILLYLGASTAVYLAATLLLPQGKRSSAHLNLVMLGFAFAGVGLIGAAAAKAWNRSARVDAVSSATHWRPVQLLRGRRIALVTDQLPVCNAFCLSLLVTARANEVIVASARERVTGKSIQSLSFRLRPDWKGCFGRMTDYLTVTRSAEDRVSHFQEYGLDPFFERDVEECLASRSGEIIFNAQLTLVNWRAPEANSTIPPGNKVGLTSVVGEQRIDIPGQPPRTRLLQLGRRYVVPAMLWPYAGNAGFGGFFELAWATSLFSTIPWDEQGDAGWWKMIKDGDDLAQEAMAVLDATVSDRRPDYTTATTERDVGSKR